MSRPPACDQTTQSKRGEGSRNHANTDAIVINAIASVSTQSCLASRPLSRPRQVFYGRVGTLQADLDPARLSQQRCSTFVMIEDHPCSGDILFVIAEICIAIGGKERFREPFNNRDGRGAGGSRPGFRRSPAAYRSARSGLFITMMRSLRPALPDGRAK